jgi:hypothetical protein
LVEIADAGAFGIDAVQGLDGLMIRHYLALFAVTM